MPANEEPQFSFLEAKPDTVASPLANVGHTRSVLEAFGLTTKYSLGQNFLINDDIIKKIIALASVSSSDTVLEVGPGIGTLTYALLNAGARVISIERDTDLVPVVGTTLAAFSDSFRLICQDALELQEETLKQNAPSGSESVVVGGKAASYHDAFSLPNKLVANLPYEVAATIVLDYFERFPFLDSATAMVQKEVADRMAATPGTKQYGAYTVKLSLYAEPAGRFKVGPGNFFPPPRVDSVVQRLNRRVLTDEQGKHLSQDLLKAACVMADASFANRRKTIANSCESYFKRTGIFKDTPGALQAIFEDAGVDPKVRGEALSPETYLLLGKALLEAAA